MRRYILVTLTILALLVACAPKAEEQPQPTQPSVPQQQVAPTPTVIDDPIPPADEVPSLELDAATNARLDTNFKSGSKIGISDQILKMRIGESKLIAIGIRALQQDTSKYQLNYSLKRTYDKSRNLIVSGTPIVDNWLNANTERPGNYGFPEFELRNNGEKRFPFLLQIKPTFADGKATKPGTYEFEFDVFTDYDALSTYKQYATVTLTVLVE